MKTKTENTEQRDWPSIEEQKQYWIDKEKKEASNNATPEIGEDLDNPDNPETVVDGTATHQVFDEIGSKRFITACTRVINKLRKENHKLRLRLSHEEQRRVILPSGNIIVNPKYVDYGDGKGQQIYGELQDPNGNSLGHIDAPGRAACPQSEQSTTAEPKPEDDLSRTEATCNFYDHQLAPDESRDAYINDSGGGSVEERE